MNVTTKVRRIAEFVFGVAILFCGLYLIALDIATLYMQSLGDVVWWTVPLGTMWGILPVMFGCRLVRGRKPVKPPAP